MAVIIDDMEVVVESPEGEAPESAGRRDDPGQQGAGRPLAPHEFTLIFRRQLERWDRVRAH